MIAAKSRNIEAGSWVWSREYECLVPKATYLAGKHNEYDEKRSDLPCPAIRPDGMQALKSMADGRVYESKSGYYKSVRRAGCEIVGTEDHQKHVAKPPSDRVIEAEIAADVKKAIQQEASKMPPAGGREDRKLMRKQRREARASKC